MDTFSGIVTLAGPENLPEGASPRNTNVDFNAGSVFTRKGLLNPFIYQNAAAGPSGGGNASDVSVPNGAHWLNVTNVLEDDDRYASCSPLQGFSLATNAISATGSWQQIQDVILPGPASASVQTSPLFPPLPAEAIFTASLPDNGVVTGIQVSFTGFAGFDTFLPSLELSFGGFSFTANITSTSPQTYTVGSPTSLWGLPWNQAILSNGVTLNLIPHDSGGVNVLFMHGLTVTVFYGTTFSDPIDITEFGFSVNESATPQGFSIQVKGYGTTVGNIGIQMLKAGVPFGNTEFISLPVSSPGIMTLGGINDLFGGTWTAADLNNTEFGIRLTAFQNSPGSVLIGYVELTAFLTPQQENFNYITTFEDDFGNIKNVALDDTGQFWLENLTENPGTLSPLFSGPPFGSFATSFTSDSRQYFAISDLLQGNYPPQQYTGQWNDRVSQVGPGASPTFTPITAGTDTFAISTITQPAAQSRGFSYFLQSSGPGSQTPGNVVTVYYSDSTLGGPDPDLVAAFNSGQPVYVYTSFTGGPVTQGPYTVQVTSVNEGQPPGQPRQFFYFTYNVSNTAFTYYKGAGNPSFTANYQRSLATVTTSVPVPGLTVGSVVTIAGASSSGFNAQWTISQTLNSGSFTISQTSVSGGVATYEYSLISGVAPVAGQLVTITGTTNGNGALNFVNATISSATGGSFTIDVSIGDFGSAVEQAQGTTAGTIFAFDPGAKVVGTNSDPIFGNSTGGTLTFEGTGQTIVAGTRKGAMFFITRNGYWTAPSPPVTFTCPEGTTSIKVSNILIGPPNVVARGIMFTEAGQEGVPGANWYWLFQPITYVVSGVTYTATSTKVDDNVTTEATFTFPDAELLNGQQLDAEDFNLFNLGELGDAAWSTQYAGRTVWGRVRNKIQNFLNLSFDGGYRSNPGGTLLPSGWDVDNATTASQPTLLVSPTFGNSYYIHNTSGSMQTILDLIRQSAFQDYNNVAILQNQTAYSVRVSVRTPSSATGGALVIDLTEYNNATGYGKTYGAYTLNLADMSSTMATYQGPLLTIETLNIPANLFLRVFGSNIPNGADIEIDRVEIFPTVAPTNLTAIDFSYANDNESFDQVTGGNDTSVVNSQPANGAFVLLNKLYVVKESSLGYFTDDPKAEPANWNPFSEVSNVAGACGINAFDVGEEWAAMACQKGLFLFNGGTPWPIQLEIPDIWKAINWQYGHTICVRNDVANRKIFCAIPLATPNPWMKDEAVNTNPTAPNVILMLNYDGIGGIEQLIEASSLAITSTGRLATHDLRRKWSLWTITTPYMGVIKRNELFAEMMFCNGTQTSKIYQLNDEETGNDDGIDFPSSYCTYGFVDDAKMAENPMFGEHNKRYAYYDAMLNGEGIAEVTFYQNILDAPYPFEVPGGVDLAEIEANNIEGPLDEYAQRLYTEISITSGWFNLSRLVLSGAKDRWAVLRGK